MKIIRILVVCIVLACFAGLGVAVLGYTLNRPADGIAAGGTVFTVLRGEASGAIAERLQAESLIRSALFLSAYSRIIRSEGGLKTGTYLIPAEATAIGIHDLLISGRQILERITIPEGWTVSKIADLMEDRGITSREAFLKASANIELLDEYGIPAENAEGYLFPDTYLFSKEMDAGRVVRHLIDTFFRQLQSIYPDYEDFTSAELFEKVVLASIIEREYKDPTDAPLISSVFTNRLAVRMRLQSCATVAYVMTEIQGNEYPEYLTYADLEIEDPYNTYRNRGLPPGPIANPGRVAIESAFAPVESDYLYFVLENPEDGRHYFSKSLGEHNLAKSLYLKSP